MLTKYEPFQAKNIMYKSNDEINIYKSRYMLNPYRGCSVGCRYCYIQQKKFNGSASFLEEKYKIVQVKINAPFLLKQKLNSDVEPGMITIGESCDPYSDVEDEYFISQRLLEILQNHRFPVHIITRFPRVMRDIEVIREISKNSPVFVTISIPVISNELVTKLEGESPSVKERLRVIRLLKKNNIVTGIAVSPIIPYISDGEEVTKVLKRSSENGAEYVIFSPLVIKDYQREMLFSWLNDKYPNLVELYKNLYRGSEWPLADYWDRFFSAAKLKADEFNMQVGLPFDFKYFEQQFFNFSSYA